MIDRVKPFSAVAVVNNITYAQKRENDVIPDFLVRASPAEHASNASERSGLKMRDRLNGEKLSWPNNHYYKNNYWGNYDGEKATRSRTFDRQTSIIKKFRAA